MPKTFQIQGFLYEKLSKQILKGFSSDNVHISPYVDKAKICLNIQFIWKKQKNVNKFLKIEKTQILPLKHILASPTLGQICNVSELQNSR